MGHFETSFLDDKCGNVHDGDNDKDDRGTVGSIGIKIGGGDTYAVNRLASVGRSGVPSTCCPQKKHGSICSASRISSRIGRYCRTRDRGGRVDGTWT